RYLKIKKELGSVRTPRCHIHFAGSSEIMRSGGNGKERAENAPCDENGNGNFAPSAREKPAQNVLLKNARRDTAMI
ncbi:MAG: hypothetical protein CRN43_04045, partial [Candidatus Nephrothrix sp. EaCA]